MKQRAGTGVTLIELLVAVIILSVFLIGLVPLLAGSVLMRRQQQLIAESTVLAQLQLEETRRFWNVLVPGPLNTTIPINFNNSNIPLFGEVSVGCNSRYIQLASVGTLDDPSTIAWNNASVRNYPIVAGLNAVQSTAAAATNGCNFKDSSNTVNSSNTTNQVRYIAQLFYGVAPGNTRPLVGNDCDLATTSSTTTCIRRVVVRIYKAVQPPNSTCNGNPVLNQVNFGTAVAPVAPELAGKLSLAAADNRNCLPANPQTAGYTRLVSTTGDTTAGAPASILNGRIPLVTLTTDITNP